MAYTAADFEMVDDHIAQGERHVERQYALIERLRSRGLPTAQAEEFLLQFQLTLRQHRAHRELMLNSISNE